MAKKRTTRRKAKRTKKRPTRRRPRKRASRARTKKKVTRKRRKKRARRKKKTARKRKRARSPRASLSRLSTAAIRAELNRRERQAERLHVRRSRLLGQLEALDTEIAAVGGQPGGRAGKSSTATPERTQRRRRRPRNKGSLVDALKASLAGKTMSVAEAAAAVQAAGYKTSSRNFRVIVNQTLLANRKVFRRVGRGRYVAR